MSRERATDIVAEMVANVIELSVQAGDRVEVGDQVMMLESMKMEIPVLADHAGTVGQVRVSVGDVIQEGDVLVTVRH
jgi:biotin carboxyl carrier protein